MTSDEDLVLESNEFHGARDHSVAMRGAMAVLRQHGCDFGVFSSCRCHLDDRILHRFGARQMRNGSDRDSYVCSRSGAAFPNDASFDCVARNAMNDHFVDKAPKQRFALLLRENILLPDFRKLGPDVFKCLLENCLSIRDTKAILPQFADLSSAHRTSFKG